jgi:colicin import membrane protein
MIADQSYRKAFFTAIFFHLILAVLLLIDTSINQHAVMTPALKNEPNQAFPIEQTEQAKEEIIKAVSVENQEIMETVNRLKQERTRQLKAEQAKQQALKQQAEKARKARIEEQKRLVKLKEEAEKLAIARKKQIETEKRHLKELAQQKEREAQRLAELKTKQQQLKKRQQEEAEKLAQLKAKQRKEELEEDKRKAEQTKKELLLAEKEREELAEKRRQEMAADAAKRARIAGEVDRYKAMIVNAISRRWILPDNVDSGLSSKFRIRLAPDGEVLEVSLIRSSGDPVLDRSAQTAIYKASPLPVPTDPDTFNLFRDISLTVRPENVRG